MDAVFHLYDRILNIHGNIFDLSCCLFHKLIHGVFQFFYFLLKGRAGRFFLPCICCLFRSSFFEELLFHSFRFFRELLFHSLRFFRELLFHVVRFLEAGSKVKVTIMFRGREQSRPDQGVRLLKMFAEDVAEFGSVESTPTIDGRNMTMVIAPHKNKSEAKAEQNAQRVASKAESKAAPEAPAPAAAAE